MSEVLLNTPVAFIIFNRPDSTQRVFSEIAKAKPSKLFVIADGPRSTHPGEGHKTEAAREIINQIDWDCDVKTNFSDMNMGCKQRVSSGINWVFEHVDEAIILEDDCLPDETFFKFCQELLEYYRNDQRVGMISGDNFQFGNKVNSHSYYFSKYSHIWGWATWRDRWLTTYDVDMKSWPWIRDNGYLKDIIGDNKEAAYWKNIFELVHNGKIDTWDYQWAFANLVEGRLNIMPNVNMITNIGFNEDATHTVGASDLANMERTSISFPIHHPIGIFRNNTADKFTYLKFFNVTLFQRIQIKLIAWSRLLLGIK